MADQDDPLLAKALEIAEEQFITASGPGGQNVNKVATAVQLRVNVFALGLSPAVFARLKGLAGSRLSGSGDLILLARRHRTQEANRQDARARLAGLLSAAQQAPAPRAKSRLNRIGKEQRLQGKKLRGAVKQGRGRVTPE